MKVKKKSEVVTKKPFATTKPRSQWKKTKLSERARGRVVADLPVQVKGGGVETRLFTFTLTSAGLRVHKERARRSKDKWWRWESLANGVAAADGQMELFTIKSEADKTT